MNPAPINNVPRRQFLKTSAAAAIGGSMTAALATPRMVHAGVDETLKVGLVGAGGRGKGAAVNACHDQNNAKLTAIAELFPDRLEDAKNQLKTTLGEKYAVPDDQCYHGFDGYKQLMETDVDVVLLTTTPHFRPAQLRAAIDAGKHVFCEKPVAVDPWGVRSVLESTELAKKKSLSIVSGLCWRYDIGVRATMEQIKQENAIGDITAIQENYLTGPLWLRGTPKDWETWSGMQYQLRNWYYYTWLSGDHIVEQHIHSLDKALWLMDDVPPKKCFGLGGRQQRTGEEYGHIYDHFSVCYEWDNGVKAFAHTRQMSNCYRQVEDFVWGTKGQAKVLAHEITGENEWRISRRQKRQFPSMYDVEHKQLFANIRSGTPLNNGEYMSYSTMLAVIGREACYSGEEILWEDAMKNPQRLGPDKYLLEGPGVPCEVAIPGVTKFA